MGKTQTTLPDPPSFGGWVATLILSLLLMWINGIVLRGGFALLLVALPNLLADTRAQQILLFIFPLLMLAGELWLLSVLFAARWRRAA